MNASGITLKFGPLIPHGLKSDLEVLEGVRQPFSVILQ